MSDLDAFETALLDDLRSTVAGRAATGGGASTGRARPSGPTSRRRVRRLSVVAVVCAAALVGLYVAMIGPTVTAQPAFAVTETTNGTVHVEVSRTEGAGALVAALAAHGITADVSYLQPRTTCGIGRYTRDGAASAAITMVIGTDAVGFDVPAGAIPKGDTLVLAMWVTPDAWRASPGLVSTTSNPDALVGVDYGVATGPVAACTPSPDAR